MNTLMKCPGIGDNALADLGIRINEAHELALSHAGKAIEHAVACGQMLLEAKAKVPHGHWLPWLRQNVRFGERSAQGYMRIAGGVPQQIRDGVSDFTGVRTALNALATPRRYWREAIDADLEAWMEENRCAPRNNRTPGKDWTIENAKACADSIRGFDEIMHRYGICPWADADDPEDRLMCTVCADEDEEKHRNGECTDNCTVCRYEREANTQRVADIAP